MYGGVSSIPCIRGSPASQLWTRMCTLVFPQFIQGLSICAELWQSSAALLGQEQCLLAQGALPTGLRGSSSPPKEAQHTPAAWPHAALQPGPSLLPTQPRLRSSLCPRTPPAAAGLLPTPGPCSARSCSWDGRAAGKGADREQILPGSPSGHRCCGWKSFTETAAMVQGAQLPAAWEGSETSSPGEH